LGTIISLWSLLLANCHAKGKHQNAVVHQVLGSFVMEAVIHHWHKLKLHSVPARQANEGRHAPNSSRVTSCNNN